MRIACRLVTVLSVPNDTGDYRPVAEITEMHRTPKELWGLQTLTCDLAGHIAGGAAVLSDQFKEQQPSTYRLEVLGYPSMKHDILATIESFRPGSEITFRLRGN